MKNQLCYTQSGTFHLATINYHPIASYVKTYKHFHPSNQTKNQTILFYTIYEPTLPP